MFKKLLKSIFSDVRSTIIGLCVIAVVGGTSGLLYLSKTALSFSIAILNTKTSLWVTILLVLTCCLYTYLKVRLCQKTQNPPNIKEELYEEELYEEYGISLLLEENPFPLVIPSIAELLRKRCIPQLLQQGLF